MELGGDELRHLYWVEKRSAREIADLLNVSATTVLNWLKREEIPRRKPGRTKKVEMSRDELYDLYWNQRKSTVEISKILGVNRSTIFEHLKKNGIKLRKRLEAVLEGAPKRRIYERKSFSGDPLEREYLLGFSEDLSVGRASSWSISVSLSTTHPSMLNLFTECFEKYGHIWRYPVCDKGSYQWRIRTLLDNTFIFLIRPRDYNLEHLSHDEFLHRLAGLIDAEGSVLLTHNGKYTVRKIVIGMGNFQLLTQVNQKLAGMGFVSKLYKRKNNLCYLNGYPLRYTRDFWLLVISRKSDVLKLLRILPLKNENKIRKALFMLKTSHIVNFDEIELPLQRLKEEIACEVQESVKMAKATKPNR